MPATSNSITRGASSRATAALVAATIAGAAAAAMLASPASAQPGALPSYGHQFVTVGAPGNRAALASERDSYDPFSIIYFPNLGAVNYSYRITKHEVRMSQWFDFVQAYSRFADQDGVSRNDPGFIGTGGIVALGSLNPAFPANWWMDPLAGNLPAQIGYEFATRYCNWLHNGRPIGEAVTRAAFETGAYDVLSTSPQQPSARRLPGARYWIPSMDEWVKATYYDPNRYGPGQEGYWPYSGMSAVPLIGGPPGVGQSSAGWQVPGGQYPPDVGSYPGTVSPWGLLDTSGGAGEYTDTHWGGGPTNPNLIGMGAIGGYTTGTIMDRLGWHWSNVSGSTFGFRVATLVPTPGGALTLSAIALFAAGRRRRMAREAGTGAYHAESWKAATL